MRPRQIKARLRERGISQNELAKRFKISGASISEFVNGRMTSARLEKRFARILGMTVAEFRGEKPAEKAA